MRALLLEQGARVLRELYLAITLDRRAKRPLLIFSTRGGMDIEALAAAEPAALLRSHLDPLAGLGAEQSEQVLAAADLAAESLEAQLADLLTRLWTLYRERDATLVEVNPLALVAAEDGPRLVALDAKVTIDDNALYRQPELAAMRPDEDERERAAREAGVTYLTLDGDIGVLGNGAGLVMSTLDLIGAAGGRAADFCDVGGGARAERIAAALGGRRLRTLACGPCWSTSSAASRAATRSPAGCSAWRQQAGVNLPLVVRLDGNNAEEGRRILQAAGIAGLRSTENALEAVELAVRRAARGEGAVSDDGHPRRRRRAASWCRASPAARAASTPSACWPPAPGWWPA